MSKVEIIKPNPRTDLKRIASSASPDCLSSIGRAGVAIAKSKKRKPTREPKKLKATSSRTPKQKHSSITELIEDLADKMLDQVEQEAVDYLKGLLR